jgi:hypothetical protein
MRYFCWMLAVVAVVETILLAMGVGIGFVLHWTIPDLGISVAILVGAISAIASGHLLVSLIQLPPWLSPYSADLESSDDDEDDDFEDIEVRAARSRSRTQRGRRRKH